MSHYTLSPLQVEPISKRDYKLLSPIIWQLQYGNDDMVCIITAGFTTDYDSTPWWARPFLRGRHLARKAHVLHDWGYNRGWVWINDNPVMLAQREWDDIWREAMVVEGMAKAPAAVMHKALKLFGHIRWNQCESKRRKLYAIVKQYEETKHED